MAIFGCYVFFLQLSERPFENKPIAKIRSLSEDKKILPFMCDEYIETMIF